MNTTVIRTFTRWLGVLAAAGMFVVLIMGAAVTNTGSEQGCGRSWPLCHGQFIPSFALKTFIEFSHRAVVGVESVMIIALAVLCLIFHRDRREIRVLAPVMVFFLFLQAALGAWAVMYPQLPAALALHFGVSLVAFASVLLTAVVLFEIRRGDGVRNLPVPRGFKRLAWSITGYSYVVVYLGAYVRHTNADDACSGWPLCNGQVLPALTGAVGHNVVHRFAAGLLALLITSLVVWSRRLRATRPDLYVASGLALGTVLLQSLSGAAVAWTKLDIFSALAHAGLVGLMFGSLTYLCLHLLPVGVRHDVPDRVAVRPHTGHATSGQ